MHNQPLVSVTMPVYNAANFLKEAIESILNQTYKNLELIIVNDASTDNSKEIIRSFSDPRISFYENPVNSGNVKTRNTCISHAKGKYIAILDNDDISSPNRLEKEVEFLESHADYGLCGSCYQVIDSNGIITSRIEVPLAFSEIKSFLILNNCFCHSSVMVRKELISENKFAEEYNLIEDYDFIYRVAGITKLANLPLLTTKYRLHGKNQSIEKADIMLALRKKMDARILNDLNIPFTYSELILHSGFVNSNFSAFKNKAELEKLEKWLFKFYGLLDKTKYDSEIILRIIIKRWILLFYFTGYISPKIFNSWIFWNYKTRYIKYLFELISDRLKKRFTIV